MTTTVATLKTGEDFVLNNTDALAQAMCDTFADKGYQLDALEKMLTHQGRARILEQLIGHFLMRVPYDAVGEVLSHALRASFHRTPLLSYDGSPQAQRDIDESIRESSDRSGYRDRVGRGAARFFSLEGWKVPGSLKKTPIGILGAGAAGILLGRTLVNAGFERVQLFDVTGRVGGLWQQKNVREGSKNNPFPFVYEQFRVEAAPGPGETITRFLEDLLRPPRQYGLKPLAIAKAKVLRVLPGDLGHLVQLRDQQGNEIERVFPILINTLGIGTPLPPSRPGVMTTETPQRAGIRWQQVLTSTQAEAFRGKTVVFIGLGNSTAEMLVQIQRLNRAGYTITYKVLTHYPQESLDSPSYSVSEHGKDYRLYRNLNQPQLTKLAGDLDVIRNAFVQARDESDGLGEILADVEHWLVEEGEQQTLVVRQRGGTIHRFPFYQLYTLIGYGHNKEELSDWGLISTDDYLGTISCDYDGEVHRAPGMLGRRRIYPGYFAFGSLLKAAHNPNAQVIPGMLFRLPDTFAGIVLRAIEYAYALRNR